MVESEDIARIPMEYRRTIGTMAAEFAALLQQETTPDADIQARTLLNFMMEIVDPMCMDTSAEHTAEWLLTLFPAVARQFSAGPCRSTAESERQH